MKLRTLAIMALLLLAALPVISAPVTMVAAWSPVFGVLIFPSESIARSVAPAVVMATCQFDRNVCVAMSQTIRYEAFTVDDGR